MNHVIPPQSRVRIVYAFAAVATLAIAPLHAQNNSFFVPQTTYDFESPSMVLNGTLEGNDNWARTFAAAPTPNLKLGTGINTTQVAQGGSTPVDGRYDLYGTRMNDGNWSFPNFNYTKNIDEAGVVQADFRYNTVLSLVTLTSNGGAADLGFFGFNGGQFEIRSQSITDVAVPGTFNVGDWVTLRMLVDWSPTPAKFGFNLGGAHYNAAATLQYKNLTDGETNFTTIAGLSNLPLGTGSGVGASANYSYYSQNFPSTVGLELWAFDTSAAIDNITIGYLIPEPTAAMLLGVGGVLFLRRKRR
jgi:hypothetical protein